MRSKRRDWVARRSMLGVRMAELLKEAGLPDGVLNIVHGDKEAVDAILSHPDIKAVSFHSLAGPLTGSRCSGGSRT